MSETKKPYEWKKETLKLRETEPNKYWKRFGQTVILAGILYGGWHFAGSENRDTALKYINDLLHPQDKTEISIDNPKVIASDVITIDTNETLAQEATESVEKMATEHGIAKEDIPYQQIQEESRDAQNQNNIQHISLPGDQYETKIIESQDKKIEVSVNPLDRFNLK
jgi:spermidine/putrescine-binding protein